MKKLHRTQVLFGAFCLQAGVGLGQQGTPGHGVTDGCLWDENSRKLHPAVAIYTNPGVWAMIDGDHVRIHQEPNNYIRTLRAVLVGFSEKHRVCIFRNRSDQRELFALRVGPASTLHLDGEDQTMENLEGLVPGQTGLLRFYPRDFVLRYFKVEKP